MRLPVAWNTYADEGAFMPDKMARVAEVVDWITGAGMFCVLDIHWDGGWIDSDVKEKYPQPDTFSPDAEKKFRSYWEQISTFFAGKNEKLIFEALNEETNFSGEGSEHEGVRDAHAREPAVHRHRPQDRREQRQAPADRHRLQPPTSRRPASREYKLPKDTIPHRLFISVHYYTPYRSAG